MGWLVAVHTLYCVFSISGGNIYFPKLYEDRLYHPSNYGPFPISFSQISDSSDLLQLTVKDGMLYALSSCQKDCFRAAVDLRMIGESCKIGQDALAAPNNNHFIEIQCLQNNHVLLVHANPEGCMSHVNNTPWAAVYKSADTKNDLQLRLVANESSILLIWLKGTNTYTLIDADSWPDSGIRQDADLTIVHNSGVPTIKDVAAISETMLVVSSGCLWTCILGKCSTLESIEGGCTIQEEGEISSGILHVVSDGERIFKLDKFVVKSAEAHSFKAFISIFCKDFDSEVYRCGSLDLDDVVLTFNLISSDLSNYFPCSVNVDGSLLACLVLGEPTIFDISDRKSLHPISSFTVSAWRLGVAVNRYGFASPSTFFFEIAAGSKSDATGFIFDVNTELQPSLIASRIIYPTLATSITPAESYLLVNHGTGDVWLNSHSGRIFYRDGKKASGLSMDFEYSESFSFFIGDSFSSAGVSHNFEHPFAFFSPDKTYFAYLSYYRSPYGAFSASALTVTNATQADLRSLVSVSDKPFIIQAGIDPSNRLLMTVQELSDDYFSLMIYQISAMQRVSYNKTAVVAQAELKGSWSWDDFDSVESTRIWVIGYTSPTTFLMASHNVTDRSTELTEFRLKSDYTLDTVRRGRLDNCLAITNMNDYHHNQTIVLCAETPLTNRVNQTFRIEMVDFESLQPVCSLKIDHVFRPLTAKYDDLTVTNIPMFDFNPYSDRMVVAYERKLLTYLTDRCPFRLLYNFEHSEVISGVGTTFIGSEYKPFSLTFVSYLQKVDIIGDCSNGYGVESVLPRNFFCSRCTPGKVGVGCLPCPSGFYCSEYSQLQPTGACPEGFFCLQGTSTKVRTSISLDRTAQTPAFCPAGAYCPAGTAEAEVNELSSKAPQPCLAGYYCPMGSLRPTQERCPTNSHSKPGAKEISDCYCKSKYYGSVTTHCRRCLNRGICTEGGKAHGANGSSLVVPVGFWPNTPHNARVLERCYVSPSKFTPCGGTTCRLICYRQTPTRRNTTRCWTSCRNPCIQGHSGRLCTQCDPGYFRLSSSHCAPCVIGFWQTISFCVAGVAFLCIMAFYFVRKHRANTSSSANLAAQNFILADGQLLEILISILLVILGLSSTTSILFMLFIVFVVYLQQLRSPPWAKLIFIFYIQTSLALLQGNFVWPSFLSFVLRMYELFYVPVPGLACLPNPITGAPLGWYGTFVLLFLFPMGLGLLVSLYIFFTRSLKKRHVWKRAFLSYCMLMSVLQFPLSNMSLSALSCRRDTVTGKFYMISQPWAECSLTSMVQILGLVGLVVYFIGIPFIMHFWYWGKVFPDPIYTELENMILPGGIPRHTLFIIFLTVRGMLLSVILSLVPVEWGIRKTLVTSILLLHILLIMYIDPYQQYTPREMDGGSSALERKWWRRLSSVHSGLFLELITIPTIIFSYSILDKKDDISFLEVKSSFVGFINVCVSVFMVVFVLMEDRLSLFQRLARLLATIEMIRDGTLKKRNYENIECSTPLLDNER